MKNTILSPAQQEIVNNIDTPSREAIDLKYMEEVYQEKLKQFRELVKSIMDDKFLKDQDKSLIITNLKLSI